MSSADVQAFKDEVDMVVDQARKALITAMKKASHLPGDEKYEAAAALVGSAIALGGFCNAVAVALSATITGDTAHAMRQCKSLADNCFTETLQEILAIAAEAEKAAGL